MTLDQFNYRQNDLAASLAEALENFLVAHKKVGEAITAIPEGEETDDAFDAFDALVADQTDASRAIVEVIQRIALVQVTVDVSR